jgi:hypothetical protein
VISTDRCRGPPVVCEFIATRISDPAACGRQNARPTGLTPRAVIPRAIIPRAHPSVAIGPPSDVMGDESESPADRRGFTGLPCGVGGARKRSRRQVKRSRPECVPAGTAAHGSPSYVGPFLVSLSKASGRGFLSEVAGPFEDIHRSFLRFPNFSHASE